MPHDVAAGTGSTVFDQWRASLPRKKQQRLSGGWGRVRNLACRRFRNLRVGQCPQLYPHNLGKQALSREEAAIFAACLADVAQLLTSKVIRERLNAATSALLDFSTGPTEVDSGTDQHDPLRTEIRRRLMRRIPSIEDQVIATGGPLDVRDLQRRIQRALNDIEGRVVGIAQLKALRVDPAFVAELDAKIAKKWLSDECRSLRDRWYWMFPEDAVARPSVSDVLERVGRFIDPQAATDRRKVPGSVGLLKRLCLTEAQRCCWPMQLAHAESRREAKLFDLVLSSGIRRIKQHPMMCAETEVAICQREELRRLFTVCADEDAELGWLDLMRSLVWIAVAHGTPSRVGLLDPDVARENPGNATRFDSVLGFYEGLVSRADLMRFESEGVSWAGTPPWTRGVPGRVPKSAIVSQWKNAFKEARTKARDDILRGEQYAPPNSDDRKDLREINSYARVLLNEAVSRERRKDRQSRERREGRRTRLPMDVTKGKETALRPTILEAAYLNSDLLRPALAELRKSGNLTGAEFLEAMGFLAWIDDRRRAGSNLPAEVGGKPWALLHLYVHDLTTSEGNKKYPNLPDRGLFPGRTQDSVRARTTRVTEFRVLKRSLEALARHPW